MLSFRLKSDCTGVEVIKGRERVLVIEIDEISPTIRTLTSFESYIKWVRRKSNAFSDFSANEMLPTAKKVKEDKAVTQIDENITDANVKEQEEAIGAILCSFENTSQNVELSNETHSPIAKKKKQVLSESYSTSSDNGNDTLKSPNMKIIRKVLLDLNAIQFCEKFPATVQHMCIGCVNQCDAPHVLCTSDRKTRIDVTFDTIVLMIDQNKVKNDFIAYFEKEGYQKLDINMFVTLQNLLKNKEWSKQFKRRIDQIV